MESLIFEVSLMIKITLFSFSLSYLTKQSINSGWPFGFYAKNSIFASRKLNNKRKERHKCSFLFALDSLCCFRFLIQNNIHKKVFS